MGEGGSVGGKGFKEGMRDYKSNQTSIHSRAWGYRDVCMILYCHRNAQGEAEAYVRLEGWR